MTRAQTDQGLRVQLADAQRINHAHEQRHQCESLYVQGRIQGAAECLLEFTNTVNEDMKANKVIIDWLTDFTHRCFAALERMGDEASNTGKQDEAVAAYSTALSLGPTTPNVVLTKWASIMVIRGSAVEASSAATKHGRLTDAVKCFLQMQSELPEDAGVGNEREEWELDFRQRCAGKLEKLGDGARDSKKHDEAIGYYCNALSLDPTNNDILLKQSAEGIELDPSSHTGYERKYAALHGLGRHGEAFEAFRVMLSRLGQSPDPHTRKLRDQYVDATATIQEVVEETIRHMPCVLIDTTTGRLYDKAQQAAAFEELPIYDELRSSMTTLLDHARIRREVEAFYRYVMLSHRWQLHEPTFQMVENSSIYGLPASPGNNKVQMFCELVCSLDFRWAWSDTCCVNQQDKGVQQESVVAMFRWYRGSSLTIIHLLGVLSESQEIGHLWRSIWNTRGWTYQEYIASKVVQFYTEDWKPYLGLDIFNHKESPLIISEMSWPPLNRDWTGRRTTREEDIAYSLFGIFKVPIPVIYGEGNQAVGRLLEYILTRSDNVTLLAWTGKSCGSHHTYLPADLTVYNEIVPPHVPRPMETAEMDDMVVRLRSSLPDHSLAVALYERLINLPALSLDAGRLRLPGIVFPLADLVPPSESDPDVGPRVYRVTSPMLRDVEIKTSDNLSGMTGLLLINPWISPLLDQDYSCGTALFDHTTCALRLVVQLMQPFGALLLAPLSRVQYRRVATDSLTMVRIREETSLTDLMGSIRTVHIQ
ncbi:hypothetical protein HD554DRAFT_2042200 [Boletus coccyginus]|nr:hypothetical protein HD554DRAFT_2042200 [Boletus coccyginus]